jgi:hypothetical protein
VNPPVELENDGITLNSGLDLVSSNLMVDKGALRDCENFEVVDRLGYQTVAGFDRFDGSLSPDQVEFWVMIYENDTLGPPDGPRRIFNAPNQILGVAIQSGTDNSDPLNPITYVVYGRTEAELEPSPGDTVTWDISPITTGTAEVIAVEKYKESTVPALAYADASVLYTRYQTLNAALRSRIDALPSQPIGTHWYRDRLYVVADEVVAGLTYLGLDKVSPNDIIGSAPFGTYEAVYRVLSVDEAVDALLLEPLEFYNGAATIKSPSVPAVGDTFSVLEEVPSVLTPAPTVILTDVAEFAATQEQAWYAGLWRSKPEPTAGWEYIETGWKLSYENGFSFSNELREVERSADNNFVFGTDDKEGLSAEWYNGTDLAPENTQITPNEPGWKNVAGFAVDDSELQTDDGDYLIGDIDFGIQVTDGLTTRIANAIVGTQPASVSQRLASVPTIPLPASGSALAGFSSARSPMMFLGLGPIFDQIPRDAQVSGFEIEAKIKVGFGCRGLMPIATYATIADAETALINQINNLFLCSTQFGQYDSETGKFTTKGQKRSSTLVLPSVRSSYTSTTSTGVTDHDVQLTYTDAADVTLTIGSSSDQFGLLDFDREDFDNQFFGMVLYGENAANPTPGVDTSATSADPFGLVGATRLSFDSLVIRVHYDEPSARYYVKEGSKVLTFDLVKNTVTSGQLRDGTAKGDLQVVNIQSVTTGSDFKTVIRGGDEIYLDSALLRKVGDVVGSTGTVAMELNGLPALKDIIAEGSRYQFITANFFAREDWDGFYGVSGAGKAFSFAAFDADNDNDEEQYLQFIYTNTIVPDEDKPRHVEFHQYHLALGYKDGTVRFSVPGEPENFDGLAGAAEVGVGDRVTGLLAMRGKALGVFCENSIYTILGDSADTFNVETLAPKTGAIEYTVVDMGIPLYCDNRGISTLEQSQKYGNFVGIRISQKVSPWILPRMTRSDNLFSLNQGAGVVCAVPVRAKNQYRIFFRDGKVLILTMNGDGSLAFTYALYYLNEDKDEFLVPIAHSSQVDGNGQERIHMAHYSPRSAISASDSRYVYEFEKGYGFDGDWFDAFFDTAFFYKDPFRDTTVRKVRADGLTKGYGPYTITVGADYDEDSYSATDVNISLPRNPAATVSDDLKPSTTMANVAKDGRCLSFRIKRDETKKTLVPPTVYQVLLVQYQNGGKRDA